MIFRPLPILSIICLPILVILIALGNWQFSRYEYKNILENSPAPSSVSIQAAIKNPHDFLVIEDEGEISDKFVKISTAMDGKYGNRYFSILKTKYGNLAYEHGFVSDDDVSFFNSQKLNTKPPSGKIKFKAVLRHSRKPNNFIPPNDINKNLFYWPEITAIAQVLLEPINVTGFYLTPQIADPFANNKPYQNPYADPKGVSYIEPARHLGYALTWWGLGIGLIIVYLALHIKQGRLGINKSHN